jgi:hypothetical protein
VLLDVLVHFFFGFEKHMSEISPMLNVLVELKGDNGFAFLTGLVILRYVFACSLQINH